MLPFYAYRNAKSIITFGKSMGYLIFTHHYPIQNCRTNPYFDWMFLLLMDWCCYAHNGSFIVGNATRGYFGGWIFALQWNSLIPIFKVCNLSPCHDHIYKCSNALCKDVHLDFGHRWFKIMHVLVSLSKEKV